MVKNCENNQNTHILSYLAVEGTYYRYFHNNIASPMYIAFLIFFLAHPGDKVTYDISVIRFNLKVHTIFNSLK